MKNINQRKKYQSQWAAQFYAAAELTRRGYLISLTLGNAPRSDLLAVSPKGTQFKVQVKGQAVQSSWLVQNVDKREEFVLDICLSSETGKRIPKVLYSCQS